MPDKPQYISKAGLKERGWTDTGITKFLGPCDKTAVNPHYRKAAPMHLFLVDRVMAAEQTDAYRQFTEKNKNRVAGAKKSVKTKKEQLLEELVGWQIEVEIEPYQDVVDDAIESYNSFHLDLRYERGHTYTPATAKSNPEFLRRITVNHLRHNLSDYDRRLDDLFGKVGKSEAYIILNQKIYTSIADAYPDLAEECERQMYRKSGTHVEFEKPVIPQRMFESYFSLPRR
jgi:hypothetical protein